MALDCGLQFSKYALFFVNFVAWLVGIALCGVAVWIIVDPEFENFADAMNFSHYFYGCYVILAAGILIVIIGFFGCCGALTENVCMLTSYFVVLIVLFLVELGAAVYLLVVGIEIGSIDQYIEKNMEDMIKNYNKDDVGVVVDQMQTYLKCCGVVGASDYTKYGIKIPSSCKDPNTLVTYKDGCYDSFMEYVASKSSIIAGLGIAVACLHLFSMVFSLCLCMGIRKKNAEKQPQHLEDTA